MNSPHHAINRILTATALLCLAGPAPSQYPTRAHTKATPSTTRAVAVLEYIGPESKPTASRLIPITLFINGHLQDASLYLARPEPLALSAGTRYEIENSGRPTGYFDVTAAGKLPADRYDTLWVGLGRWHALGPIRPRTAKKNPAPAIIIDDGKPHLLRRPGSEDTGPENIPANKNKSTTTNSSSNDASPNGNPPDDPDRPLLHRSPASAAPATTAANAPPETNLQKLGDDPDRPVLHRGKPTTGANAEPAAQLHGNPILMQQRVAVSDANPRGPHPFTYTWPNPSTAAKLQAQLETIAQKAIADSISAQPQPSPPAITLAEEKLTTFQLANDANPTLIFSAHTNGEGAQLRYVTLIAQLDIYGAPTILLKNVTDEAHLDQTPRMKLIDAVDAEGNNRGDLLFELRAENERQFALYRINNGTATQIFLTGAMP